MLEPTTDVADLACQLVDIESVSGGETRLADAIHTALRDHPHLDLTRLGNVIVARTRFGRASRVAIAGHIDTVPVVGNLPGRRETIEGRPALVGRGACDMKGGLAVQLHLAATITDAGRDITWIFYDNEEVEASRNGLGRLAAARPGLLEAGMAILMEPSDARIEAGCQGTLRARITTTGRRAHSARSWLGHNAIHDMAGALTILDAFQAEHVSVDGLVYREGLNAVGITGGIAGNIIPDRCELNVNYRFAPDKDIEAASRVLREIFAGYAAEILDAAPAARPCLDDPLVASLVAAVGEGVKPKFGWTDVARFAALGIPAVNYGPGDPGLAHTDDEFVFLDSVAACTAVLRNWLATSPE